MPSPNFVILYCAVPDTSVRFYADLLQRQPVEQSPTFALFDLDNGLMLGLWARTGVVPAPPQVGSAHELALALDSRDAVVQQHQRWEQRGLPVLLAPTDLDFGYTAVTADPDGHRFRVFAPTGG